MNTRRYPRTMQQAFGPYTDNRLHPMAQPSPSTLRARLSRWLRRIFVESCK